jgi:hypothetical protein
MPEDSKTYFDRRMREAGEEYETGLQHTGMGDNPRLKKAFMLRRLREAKVEADTQARAEYDADLAQLRVERDQILAKRDADIAQLFQGEAQLRQAVDRRMTEFKQRDRQINREGARAALVFCPIAILMFSAVAWFNFHQGDQAMGLLYTVGALIFLAMLTGAIARLKK